MMAGQKKDEDCVSEPVKPLTRHRIGILREVRSEALKGIDKEDKGSKKRKTVKSEVDVELVIEFVQNWMRNEADIDEGMMELDKAAKKRFGYMDNDLRETVRIAAKEERTAQRKEERKLGRQRTV